MLETKRNVFLLLMFENKQHSLILLHRDYESNALEKFILDKCSKSIHFALQVSWILQSYIEDPSILPNIKDKSVRLREDCESKTLSFIPE